MRDSNVSVNREGKDEKPNENLTYQKINTNVVYDTRLYDTGVLIIFIHTFAVRSKANNKFGSVSVAWRTGQLLTVSA